MTATMFHNKTMNELISIIEDLLKDGDTNTKRICDALFEISKQKGKHPLFKHPVFKWFKEISTEKLHPRILASLKTKRYLDHVLGRPMDVQDRIAAGKEFDVVKLVKGEIVVVKQSFRGMNYETFSRLFPIGKPPATVSEQTKSLEAQMEQMGKTKGNAQVIQPDNAPTIEGSPAGLNPTSIPLTFTKRRSVPSLVANRERQIFKVGDVEIPLSAVIVALEEIGITVNY